MINFRKLNRELFCLLRYIIPVLHTHIHIHLYLSIYLSIYLSGEMIYFSESDKMKK